MFSLQRNPTLQREFNRQRPGVYTCQPGPTPFPGNLAPTPACLAAFGGALLWAPPLPGRELDSLLDSGSNHPARGPERPSAGRSSGIFAPTGTPHAGPQRRAAGGFFTDVCTAHPTSPSERNAGPDTLHGPPNPVTGLADTVRSAHAHEPHGPAPGSSPAACPKRPRGLVSKGTSLSREAGGLVLPRERSGAGNGPAGAPCSPGPGRARTKNSRQSVRALRCRLAPARPPCCARVRVGNVARWSRWSGRTLLPSSA